MQVLEAREGLTGYARTRYDTAATNAQQGLIEYAQELREDDLHTRMPDIVKKSGWNRQFKSHDKTKKRLMTGAEAAERDANSREQAAAQEAHSESEGRASEEEAEKKTKQKKVEKDTEQEEAEERASEEEAEEEASEEEAEEEAEQEEAEEKVGGAEAFILPPSTAPAILSRAGRKRAPTMKALEAEMAPKRGTGQGRAGRGRGRGSRGGR